jgi:hypothetical protein
MLDIELTNWRRLQRSHVVKYPNLDHKHFMSRSLVAMRHGVNWTTTSVAKVKRVLEAFVNVGGPETFETASFESEG